MCVCCCRCGYQFCYICGVEWKKGQLTCPTGCTRTDHGGAFDDDNGNGDGHDGEDFDEDDNPWAYGCGCDCDFSLPDSPPRAGDVVDIDQYIDYCYGL